MISIKDALEEIIQGYAFIEIGLSKGIINYSAFAREIKPQIEKKLYKSVKEGAIVMALKRISGKLPQTKFNHHTIDLTDITIRANLEELTFQNSNTLPEKILLIFKMIAVKKDVVCILSGGIRETAFIISPELKNDIKRICADETLVADITNLSAITIRQPPEVVYIPGVYYQILKILSWENINIIDVLSVYNEITIVVNNKDVDRAFSVIQRSS